MKPVQVKSEWLGKRRFKAEGPSGCPVMIDAGMPEGGEGSGNSPLELVLTGLVGCIGIGVTKLLDKMRQSLEALEITAVGRRAEEIPHEITEVHLTFRVEGEVAPSRIWQAVKLECDQYCPVAASLKASIVPHIILNGEPLPPPGQTGRRDRPETTASCRHSTHSRNPYGEA
ncbi:OsmC family protein [Paenibacillus piri]|nr:OsmC family protein [Paenibacillus piri]